MFHFSSRKQGATHTANDAYSSESNMPHFFKDISSPVTISQQFLFELETGLVPEPESVGPALEQPAAAAVSEAGSEQG